MTDDQRWTEEQGWITALRLSRECDRLRLRVAELESECGRLENELFEARAAQSNAEPNETYRRSIVWKLRSGAATLVERMAADELEAVMNENARLREQIKNWEAYANLQVVESRAGTGVI